MLHCREGFILIEIIAIILTLGIIAIMTIPALPPHIKIARVMKGARRGFTLIELIVVVIIVGILAAIAGPMMTGNINKARRAEAIAACGALRTAARCYITENPTNTAYARTDLLSYVTAVDINGKYYNSSDYTAASDWIKASNACSMGWVNMDTATGNLTQG